MHLTSLCIYHSDCQDDVVMSDADVHHCLQVVADRLVKEGHFLEAIKCHVATLIQSLLPADEATARLKLAQLLLEHTSNVADGKQHLQKAELLVTGLPGQQLLHCDVLAALGHAHKYLGETAFQRQSYLKGVELCKDTSRSKAANKRSLIEWGVYFHMRVADSYIVDKQPGKAVEHAKAGTQLAREHGLLDKQMLCLMFRLQLIMLMWDKPEAEQVIQEASEVLQQLQQPGSCAEPGYAALLKLNFTILQVLISIQVGNFQELCPPNVSPPPLISDMEAQLEALPAAHSLPYCWLPAAALGALVQLLAAVILKPTGKVKAALLHISRGLQMIDDLMVSVHVGPGVTEASVDHVNVYTVRSCLVLRVLLLETRQQLNLLASNFAAARLDVADNIQLLQRFPTLLVSLQPSVHLQAGLYSQAVGAYDAAVSHLSKAAQTPDDHMRVCARCLAALSYLAQGAPDAVNHGRELLGDLLSSVESDMGYAERAVAHIAGGLLQLSAVETSAEEKADAKQRLSKALKLAHGRLQNHQLVSQVLLFMTPLQVSSADSQGALQMVTSSFTLAKGAGDLHAQVAGLSMMQQLYLHSKQPDKAAQNANYLARKQEDLSGKIQEAEAGGQQHMQILVWDV